MIYSKNVQIIIIYYITLEEIVHYNLNKFSGKKIRNSFIHAPYLLFIILFYLIHCLLLEKLN